MKNLFSVSPIFDARRYEGSEISCIDIDINKDGQPRVLREDYAYPYTFLLANWQFLFSFADLPCDLPFAKERNGIGFPDIKTAEIYREKIIRIIQKNDFVLLAQFPQDFGSGIYNRPIDMFGSREATIAEKEKIGKIPSFFYVTKYSELKFKFDTVSTADAKLTLYRVKQHKYTVPKTDWTFAGVR